MVDQEMLQAMAQLLEPIKNEISGIKSEMSGMKSEMSGMKSEISGINTKLDDLQKGVLSEFRIIHENMATKEDLAELRAELKEDIRDVRKQTAIQIDSQVSSRIGDLETRVGVLEDKARTA